MTTFYLIFKLIYSLINYIFQNKNYIYKIKNTVFFFYKIGPLTKKKKKKNKTHRMREARVMRLVIF